LSLLISTHLLGRLGMISFRLGLPEYLCPVPSHGDTEFIAPVEHNVARAPKKKRPGREAKPRKWVLCHRFPQIQEFIKIRLRHCQNPLTSQDRRSNGITNQSYPEGRAAWVKSRSRVGFAASGQKELSLCFSVLLPIGDGAGHQNKNKYAEERGARTGPVVEPSSVTER